MNKKEIIETHDFFVDQGYFRINDDVLHYMRDSALEKLDKEIEAFIEETKDEPYEVPRCHCDHTEEIYLIEEYDNGVDCYRCGCCYEDFFHNKRKYLDKSK